MRKALLAVAVLVAFAVAGRVAVAGPDAIAATTREYWIAAVPTTWDVAPSDHDPIMDMHLDPAKTTMQAVVFKAFTSGWTTQLPDNPNVSGDNDGIPGPLIKGRVGDTILIHFKNLDPARPHSMHFHGVHYDFPSDGAFIPGVTGAGADVKPGQSFTYKLVAKADSVGVWPYHDHSQSMMTAIPGGLYGAMSILGAKEKAPDREFVVAFESQLGFNTINGRAFIGNTPTFRAKVGETVQFDVIALGDFHHTFHVHGHRWFAASEPRDVQTVGPAESFRFRWKEDAPGTWLYHCHVENHMMNGMIGTYVVSK
jgi:FtsP/CotA-like multicopper oxidase with cupredoxin domain